MQSKWLYPSGAPYAVFDEKKRTFFYETGQIKTIEEICDETLHGSIKLFWPNGALKRKAFFSFGQRDGSDEMWDEEGRLRDQSFYERGKPVGVHRRWNDKGILIEEQIFLEKGRFNFKKWDEEGELKAEGNWEEEKYKERRWDLSQNIWVEYGL